MSDTKTVREFSAAGPCITLGYLVERTPKTIYYRELYPAPGETISPVRKRSGRRVANGLIHTEPCTSCRDHTATMYPDGYMD